MFFFFFFFKNHCTEKWIGNCLWVVDIKEVGWICCIWETPEYYRVPRLCITLHPLLFYCAPGGSSSQKISQVSSVFLVHAWKNSVFGSLAYFIHTLQVYGEFFQVNYTTHLSRRSFLSDVLWWHNIVRRSLLCHLRAPAMLLEGRIFQVLHPIDVVFA